jgi:serine/threonine-protein phosphatase 6 regulatory ankyrin repeat subunit B
MFNVKEQQQEPLINAASNGDLRRVKALLASGGSDVNSRLIQFDDVTALMTASYEGHLEVVQALLAAKANVNARRNDGGTALMMASQEGHLEVVRALLDAKADVNARRYDGATALMLASQEGHLEVVRTLLDARADVSVNAEWSNGISVLIMGHRNGKPEEAMRKGVTALILAAQGDHQEVVQLLKSAGAH